MTPQIKKFKNSIAKNIFKMSLTTTIGFVFFAGSTAFFFWSLDQKQKQIDFLYSQSHKVHQLGNLIFSAIQDTYKLIHEEENEHAGPILAKSEDFSSELEKIKQEANTQKDAEAYSFAIEAEPEIAALRSSLFEIVQHYRQGQIETAKTLYKKSLKVTSHHILSYISNGVYLREIKIRNYIEKISALRLYMTLALCFIFAAVVALHVFIGFRLQKKIVVPVLELTHQTRSLLLAKHQTKDQTMMGANDEVEALSRAFSQMSKRLQKAFEYADNIIRSTVDMLFVLERDGEITKVNENTENILGYKGRFLIGKPFRILLGSAPSNETGETGSTAVVTDQNIMELLQNHSLKEVSAFFVTENKTSIPVSLSSNLMQNVDGEIEGVIVSAKDERESNLIKELKKTQKQLVQSAKLASLGELSAGVAHELNQPLFLIQGFAGRIKSLFTKHEQVSRNQVEDYIKEIQENVTRADGIIRHMRDFSRQAGQRSDPITINDVIEKSFTLLNEQLRLRGIDVQKDLTPENPVILGDKNRLEQVFVNFLTNSRDAIESSPRKAKGMISVRSMIQSDSVVIEFSDNGTGVDEGIINRIFDPFFTTKEVGKGTGLGLSIVHGIIQEHKGRIECHSKGGNGATFKVTLPIFQAQKAAA